MMLRHGAEIVILIFYFGLDWFTTEELLLSQSSPSMPAARPIEPCGYATPTLSTTHHHLNFTHLSIQRIKPPHQHSTHRPHDPSPIPHFPTLPSIERIVPKPIPLSYKARIAMSSSSKQDVDSL
jgi:hypothetical protein